MIELKRSRVIIGVVIVIAAIFVIWRIGFYTPKPKLMKAKVKTPAAAGPNEPNKVDSPGDVRSAKIADVNERGRLSDVNQPRGWGRRPRRGDANDFGGFAGFDGRRSSERRGQMGSGEFGRPSGFGDFDRRRGLGAGPEGVGDTNEPNMPGDSNEPMEALNLKNVEMKDVIQKISEWTGKTVIPADEVMQQRITVYSPKRLPRSKALSHIYGALRMKGFVAEHTDDAIYLVSIKDAKLRFVPTIEADQPLAALENKDQIVQKFFKLVSYQPAQMGQIIQPLVGEYGYVSADETTGTLLVIDTVANLIRIEGIIAVFDVPEAEQTVTKIFTVQYGDPSEIVQMLKMLLGESEGYSSLRSGSFGRRSSDRGRGGSSSPSSGSAQASGSSQRSESAGGAAASVVISSARGPIVLIPEPRRKWIIARGSAEDINQIEQWIQKLDKEEPVESEYEVIPLRYADAREVQDSIVNGFRNLPGTEFLPNVLVEPLPNSKQVIVFGRKDLREIVKKMIQEVDVPPGQFETRHFRLKYADPDQIKTNIDELYEEGLYGSSSSSSGYGRYNPRGRGSYQSGSTTSSSETVRVISYVSLKQVTVIASPENMEKIAEQISQWDVPIDVNEVRPRIIELRNSDPIEMADLLTTLFSEESDRGISIYDILFGRTEDKQKIVGPLYGQLTFEDVPGTKKIIVISKIPEAYDVIEQLVHELDKQEMAEIPKVITLKYADPEDLAQRLNALFNELGTTATISFSERGLSEARQDEADTSSTTSTSSSSSSSGSSTSSTSEYRPWWNTGRQSTEEMPISNVIGRVRFIPDPRSKSLLVLAPPEFMERIDELIQELDIPGKQVMVKAVIVQVDHSNMTSLGLQLSSDQSKWSTLDNENAVTALSTLSHLAESGSLTLEVGMSVTTLVDFLVRELDAKILNQQTLWTKDNEEAEFFKGQVVAFQTEVSVSDTGGRATSQYEYEQVGMTLKARPSITPEKNVDMIIRVILSQLATEEINNQRVRTAMDTTTNMIIQDGQTIMLGGILFQEVSTVKRKLPLLGDAPVIGGLFRHKEAELANSEMLIFITPYVIDEPDKMLPETIEEIEQPKKKLEKVKEELNKVLGEWSETTETEE